MASPNDIALQALDYSQQIDTDYTYLVVDDTPSYEITVILSNGTELVFKGCKQLKRPGAKGTNLSFRGKKDKADGSADVERYWEFPMTGSIAGYSVKEESA